MFGTQENNFKEFTAFHSLIFPKKYLENARYLITSNHATSFCFPFDWWQCPKNWLVVAEIEFPNVESVGVECAVRKCTDKNSNAYRLYETRQSSARCTYIKLSFRSILRKVEVMIIEVACYGFKTQSGFRWNGMQW